MRRMLAVGDTKWEAHVQHPLSLVILHGSIREKEESRRSMQGKERGLVCLTVIRGEYMSQYNTLNNTADYR